MMARVQPPEMSPIKSLVQLYVGSHEKIGVNFKIVDRQALGDRKGLA